MMISAEDLCSLTPTTQLNKRPRIRPETVCYVLAGVSKEASNFLRLKYANDDSQILYVAHELANRSRKRASDNVDDDMLFGMALIAIQESLSDSMCGTCNGKAWVSTGEKMIVCFKCRGSGRRSRSSKEIAEEMGVSMKFYKDECKHVIERYMLGVLSNYEGELHNALRERLY
jgi:hypothetical protein